MLFRGVAPVLTEVLLVGVLIAAAIAVYAYVVQFTAIPHTTFPAIQTVTVDSANYSGNELRLVVRGVGHLSAPMLYVYSGRALVGAYVPSVTCSGDLCTLSTAAYLGPGTYTVELRAEGVSTSAMFSVLSTVDHFTCDSCESCNSAITKAFQISANAHFTIRVILLSDISSNGSPCINVAGTSGGSVVFDLNGHEVSANQANGPVVEVNGARMSIVDGQIATLDTPCTSGVSVNDSNVFFSNVLVSSACGEGSASVRAVGSNVLFDLRDYNSALCDSSDSSMVLVDSNVSCSCGAGTLYLTAPNNPDLPCSCVAVNSDDSPCSSTADSSSDETAQQEG